MAPAILDRPGPRFPPPAPAASRLGIATVDSRWKRSSADGILGPPTGAFPVSAALDNVRKVLLLHHVGELDLAGFHALRAQEHPAFVR